MEIVRCAQPKAFDFTIVVDFRRAGGGTQHHGTRVLDVANKRARSRRWSDR